MCSLSLPGGMGAADYKIEEHLQIVSVPMRTMDREIVTYRHYVCGKQESLQVKYAELFASKISVHMCL